MQGRQSTYSNLNGYPPAQDRHMNDAGMMHNSPYGQTGPNRAFSPPAGSTDNLMAVNSHMSFAGSSPNLLGGTNRARSPAGVGGANARASAFGRPTSTVNFMDGPSNGPSDQEIQSVVAQTIKEVDLDAVGKKQIKALIEQRLQTQLQGEKKAFMDRCIDEELFKMEI
jgi:chitin synthase